MQHVITLPNSRRVTVGQYVEAWRKLKAVDPQTDVEGWDWYSLRACDILRGFSFGVNDRINRKGGITPAKPWDMRRVTRKLGKLVKAGAIKCACRWCGSELGEYRPAYMRFCDASCKHSFCG